MTSPWPESGEAAPCDLVTLPCDLPQWPEVRDVLQEASHAECPAQLVGKLSSSYRLVQQGTPLDFSEPHADTPTRSDKNVFRGLQGFLQEMCSQERHVFFSLVLPDIVQRALDIETLAPEGGLRYCKQQQGGKSVLSRRLVASIVCCSFLGLFPGRRADKHSKLNSANFTDLYPHLKNAAQREKLRNIMHYFSWLASTTDGPSGHIVFSRQVMAPCNLPSLEDWEMSTRPLCDLRLFPEGLIEDAGPHTLQVDFANKKLGGGVLGTGRVQEEIRFSVCPELIAGMLFMESMEDNEAIVIHGFQQFAAYSGYAQTLQCQGAYVDNSQMCGDVLDNSVCAIDALPAGRIGGAENQYRDQWLLRDLNKSWVGFQHGDLLRQRSRSHETENSSSEEFFSAVESLSEEGFRDLPASVGLMSYVGELSGGILQGAMQEAARVLASTPVPVPPNLAQQQLQVPPRRDSSDSSSRSSPASSSSGQDSTLQQHPLPRRRKLNMADRSSSQGESTSSSSLSKSFSQDHGDMYPPPPDGVGGIDDQFQTEADRSWNFMNRRKSSNLSDLGSRRGSNLSDVGSRRSSNLSDMEGSRRSSGTSTRSTTTTEFSSEFEEYYESFQKHENKRKHYAIKEEVSNPAVQEYVNSMMTNLFTEGCTIAAQLTPGVQAFDDKQTADVTKPIALKPGTGSSLASLVPTPHVPFQSIRPSSSSSGSSPRAPSLSPRVPSSSPRPPSSSPRPSEVLESNCATDDQKNNILRFVDRMVENVLSGSRDHVQALTDNQENLQTQVANDFVSQILQEVMRDPALHAADDRLDDDEEEEGAAGGAPPTLPYQSYVYISTGNTMADRHVRRRSPVAARLIDLAYPHLSTSPAGPSTDRLYPENGRRSAGQDGLNLGSLSGESLSDDAKLQAMGGHYGEESERSRSVTDDLRFQIDQLSNVILSEAFTEINTNTQQVQSSRQYCLDCRYYEPVGTRYRHNSSCSACRQRRADYQYKEMVSGYVDSMLGKAFSSAHKHIVYHYKHVKADDSTSATERETSSFADSFIGRIIQEGVLCYQEEYNERMRRQRQSEAAWRRPWEAEIANMRYFDAEFSPNHRRVRYGRQGRKSYPGCAIRSLERLQMKQKQQQSFDERIHINRHRQSSVGFQDDVLSNFELELQRSNTLVPPLDLSHDENSMQLPISSAFWQRRSSEPANQVYGDFLSCPLAEKRTHSMDSISSREIILDWLHSKEQSQSESSLCGSSGGASKIPRRSSASHLDWYVQDLLIDAFSDAFMELFGADCVYLPSSSSSHHYPARTLDQYAGIVADLILSDAITEVCGSSSDPGHPTPGGPVRHYAPRLARRDSQPQEANKESASWQMEEVARSFTDQIIQEASDIVFGAPDTNITQTGRLRPIATGNWGCGAFRGDPQLKALIQWMSASQVRAPCLMYYTFGNDKLTQFADVIVLIEKRGWKVGQLLQHVVRYCRERSQAQHTRGQVYQTLFQYLVNESQA